MISHQEIMDFAREFSLAPQIVEKDYVLGWLLAGISAHPALADSWAFKGGTCLKKCYFETYRFSEDLDFTLTNPDHLGEDFLVEVFSQISEWTMEQSGIEMPRETLRFEVYENPRGKKSVQGRIGYRGPMSRRGDVPRIKLDLTNDEVLVLELARRPVHHPYSDNPPNGIEIGCYAFEEVFAEKIRALAERERPRDLYDVVHLYRHDELRPDRAQVVQVLQEKCTFKGIPVPDFQQLDESPHRVELEAEWANMLAHQLPVLPAFAQFWQELPALFEWLHRRMERPSRPAIRAPGPRIDETWRPPAMGTAWNMQAPLEIIRFAAANHLCIDLEYRDQRGRTSNRLIEPYSLRRSQEGNLLLYAVKHETGESRSYRVDRILGAEATRTSFVPRFQIELTPVGPISAPTLTRPQSVYSPSRDPRPRSTVRRHGRVGTTHGMKYVFRCTVCHKLFYRKSYDASLNAHKNKRGLPCPGRIGIHVKTTYR
ncbi:MAG: nucleotidyl transferase AbiEii/AbiGii toxin family protein [Gammaproteobacteria bacterium]|nr:nucleotidyl transferase AbiEii/AbiGii toxin family protein [Gammaproteobacteria bacterium]